jgi:ribosomal protein L28
MSKMCEICGKTYLKGNLVPRGIGNRVTRRTITRQQPNLRIKHMQFGSNKVKVKLCSSCLKKLKKEGVLDSRNAAIAPKPAEVSKTGVKAENQTESIAK